MKPLFLTICIACYAISTAFADSATPFSTNINNMWLSGNKNGVLAIANQRLQHNSNDLAGLIIALEYQLEFSEITKVKSTMHKVVAVGNLVKTANFKKLYPQLKSDLLYMETSVLPNITPELAQTEAAKGNISGKPMDLLNILQAVELDGLIQ